MAHKSAIILVTGFLGCGKTTLLKELLLREDMGRIAVIQNEFSQTSIDGDILRETGRDFELRELNTGSIFCVCLFSKFKETVREIATQHQPRLIVVEASGIADPIAIAELMEDESVADVAYLSRILTVVDAPRFEGALSKIVGVKHQVQVADAVLVNKCDLSSEEELERVTKTALSINPQARLLHGTNGQFELDELLDGEAHQHKHNGELTRCGEGGYISKSFRYAGTVSRAKLDEFLATLTADTLRLKGYITTPEGENLMVHYVPNQIEITECKTPLMGRCELISIGFAVPQFAILKQ